MTYHGPGQLVGYPIMDLNNMATPTRCYVDHLQSILHTYIRSELGLENANPPILAPHPEGHIGVFAGENEKVASIGIHLRHRITSHGFATNVTSEPTPWFDLVMACGLADVHATSMRDLMLRQGVARQPPSVRQVAEDLLPFFSSTFGRPVVDVSANVEADEETETLRDMIVTAEEVAKAENARNGGWPSKPNVDRV